MDVVIVRENEEDTYAGIEYRQTDQVEECLKLISRPGSEKIVRYAFEYAKKFNRKKVTCFIKDNIMKQTDGLFHRVFDEKGINYGYDQWYYYFMSVAKVTISIESGLLKKVDYLVKERVFSNRSQAIQSAVAEKVSRLDRNRLARECAKLNKAEEQSLADLGLASEVGEWLEY